MKSSPSELEQELIAQLRRAEPSYRRAAAMLASEFHPESGMEDVSTCVQRLQPLMQRVQEHEDLLAPLRQQWLTLRCTPGGELRRLLGEHEQLLQGLISRIHSLESHAARLRRTLLPEVDSYVRHHQMQKAYQQQSR